jgi:putative Ca2+/H+ antiporter (TMEM165/GDT1 family)
VIFLAELGDKSQLMAMTFALRYRWWVVLSGILAASAAGHMLSVGIGHFLGAAIPGWLIAAVAGSGFLIMGLLTLRDDGSDAAESAPTRSAAPAFFAVTVAFLLAELGDKTMFATVSLAADHDWLGVWLGSTAGMAVADALAIAIGALAGKHLPRRAIQITAGLAFLYFGAHTLLAAGACH